MKNPRLRVNKKGRVKAIRKFKREITEIVGDCLEDIKWYIVDDLMKYFKKQGIIYAKASKKNKKKNKK